MTLQVYVSWLPGTFPGSYHRCMGGTLPGCGARGERQRRDHMKSVGSG
jgi:hypothetical protein